MTAQIEVQPADAHNEQLVANVHPANWKNPTPQDRYNLVVIGAGSAGLITAAIAAGLGARVALVERYLMGGDCLNVGCVPSKSLIRAARMIAEARAAEAFGIPHCASTDVDFGAVMERMRRIRARISHEDSARRYRDELGVDVFLGDARFSGADTVEVNGAQLRFKKAVIASGARAAVPPIEGLAEAGYLTNETVFELTERPNRLGVIGGGPIGAELAQAFRRLGSDVTVIDRAPQLLPREDPDAAQIIADQFAREGITTLLDCELRRVEALGDGKRIHLTDAKGTQRTLDVDAILVAVGRAPNVEGLNLEAVGVEYDPRRGVYVNDYLQTRNPNIYAAGDIAMDWKFTHAADAAAKIVAQNALFLRTKKLSSLVMPWCTYTDPEVAHVGLYEREATERGIELTTFKVPLSEVNRAAIDGEDTGFVKIHIGKRRGRTLWERIRNRIFRVGPSDQILGATIVASHAGEMVSEVTLAMVNKLGLSAILSTIHPYPTQAEALKRAAGAYLRGRVTPRMARISERLMALRR
ncbi:MAG: mercuric reductase [Deltaproteobacteria bacterium]|nr:mercuric reductase [Deltaproteobacteria bacterium]